MANTFTAPVWVKSKTNVGAEMEVGHADPNSRPDVINRPAKGFWANLQRIVNSLFDGVTIDGTDQATTAALNANILLRNAILALGTTVVAGANAGDICLGNNRSLRILKADGTTQLCFLNLDAANNFYICPGLGVGVLLIGGQVISHPSGQGNQPVSVGAPDSGGAGYRALRVPNT